MLGDIKNTTVFINIKYSLPNRFTFLTRLKFLKIITVLGHQFNFLKLTSCTKTIKLETEVIIC